MLAPWLGQVMAFRWTRLSGSGSFIGNVGRTLGLLTGGGFCHSLGAAGPPPLFASFIRVASLVGGNCGIQKCNSIGPLSLVIKCLEGGRYESGDLVVPMIDKRPSPSEGQLNTYRPYLQP
jgi:hypothetical protein